MKILHSFAELFLKARKYYIGDSVFYFMARLPETAEKLIYGASYKTAKKSMTRSARRRAFAEHHISRIYELAYDHDRTVWLSASKVWEIFHNTKVVADNSNRKTKLFGYFAFSQESISKFTKSLASKEILNVSKEITGKGYQRVKKNYFRKAENGKTQFFSPTVDKLDDFPAESFVFNRKLHQFQLK